MKPKTYLRYKLESTSGKRLSFNLYQDYEEALMYAPMYSIARKVWVTEGSYA